MEIYDNPNLEDDSKVVIFYDEQSDKTSEVFIYLQDLNEDGEIFFNIDYQTNYLNGTFENGNGFVELNKITEAYGFDDYNELSSYFCYTYENDKDSFKKIVKDIQQKGIKLNLDECQGF